MRGRSAVVRLGTQPRLGGRGGDPPQRWNRTPDTTPRPTLPGAGGARGSSGWPGFPCGGCPRTTFMSFRAGVWGMSRCWVSRSQPKSSPRPRAANAVEPRQVRVLRASFRRRDPARGGPRGRAWPKPVRGRADDRGEGAESRGPRTGRRRLVLDEHGGRAFIRWSCGCGAEGKRRIDRLGGLVIGEDGRIYL
jgi:hypothetical protein